MWGTVAAIAGSYLANQQAGAQQRKDAKNALNRALAQYNGISVPTIEDQRLTYEQLQNAGELNPELQENYILGPSAMEGISLDPKYRQAQLDVLSKLQDITSSDGKDAQFLADSARLQNDVNSNLKGNMDAIQQNMATRGLSGGMSELVAKQISGQNASNRQAQAGLDINAQAQQRALQALMNQSNVANQISENEFNQKSQIAQSQDAISKFNTQNLQNVSNSNIQARNDAQATNLQNKQRVMDANVGIRNQQQQYNKELQQKNFQNSLDLANSKNGIYSQQSKNSLDEANQQRQFWGNLIQAGANAYGSSKK